MASNSRKKYVNIDINTGSNEIHAILDDIGSHYEEDLDDLMNDSDTEFISETPLPEIDSNNNTCSLLIPEAIVHVIEPIAKKTTKKRKLDEMKWTNSRVSAEKKTCILEAPDVTLELPEYHTPYIVYENLIGLDELLDIVVEQSVLYASQNGRVFATNYDEMRAFLGMNYLMGINKLPSLKDYWGTDTYIGNDGIKNVMARSRFVEILRNLHIADNTKDDKTDRGYKVRPLIDHLNLKFQEAMSAAPKQSADEHMTKFKVISIKGPFKHNTCLFF